MINHDFKNLKQNPSIQSMDSLLRNPPAYSEKVVQVIKVFVGKKIKYSDQRARKKTSIKTALPVETVNEYLTCSEFFENSTLKLLSEAKLNKKQYHIISKVVNRASLKLRQDGLVDKKIKSWIGKLVIDMLTDYKKHNKINQRAWTLEWASFIGYIKKEVKIPEKKYRSSKVKSFSYQPGMTRGLDGPKSTEQIQRKVYMVIEDLCMLPKVDVKNVDRFKKGIINAIGDLGSIGVSLNDIEKDEFTEDERWAI